VVANPGSYAQGMSSAKVYDDLRWENPLFDSQMVVTI
jgi:hypothetical protein